MSTLTITISRDGDDLVLSGSNDANPIGVTNYQEPPRQARIRYAPQSDMYHGDEALGSTYQQSLLSFDVVTHKATTEAASRTSLAELLTAISQFSYTVTVVVDGAPAETWACDTGSLTPTGGRTLTDLKHHNPVWSVQIPCKPVPTIGA